MTPDQIAPTRSQRKRRNRAAAQAARKRLAALRRCSCIKVVSKVDGLTYRLTGRDNRGAPTQCLAHMRSPQEIRLRQLQRANRRGRRPKVKRRRPR